MRKQCISKRTCDVLVIGSGMAGIRAAIEAYDSGVDVILISKRTPGVGGSSFFPNTLPWGIMTSGEGKEASEVFYQEVVGASHGCIDQELVKVMAERSNECFQDLLEYGVKFNRLSQEKRIPCFGSKPRGAQLNDFPNLQACIKAQLQKRAIHIVENTNVLDLVVKDGRCFGAIGVAKEGELVLFQAGAVVLATGGAEDLWKYNVVTPDISGDGYAMALRKGCSLTNMEFVQFIPATINTGGHLNFHTLSFASVEKVLNHRNEEFLQKYLPVGVSVEKCLSARATHGPFSNEDESRYFDIAACKEDPEGTVGVEIIYGADFYKEGKYERWKNFLHARGVDFKKEHLNIYPHCQGFNGGIVIDKDAATQIQGLYACGESAGGPHGANRMGGNAILATQVFGKIAGANAAKYALRQRSHSCPDMEVLSLLKENFDTGYSHKLSSCEVRDSIKKLMHENATVIRTGAGLDYAMNEIVQMKKMINPYQVLLEEREIVGAVGAYHKLLTAHAVLYSMFHREESRGPHYREDYPVKSNDSKMSRVCLNELSL